MNNIIHLIIPLGLIVLGGCQLLHAKPKSKCQLRAE